jgi:hypothetical protein
VGGRYCGSRQGLTTVRSQGHDRDRSEQAKRPFFVASEQE